MKPTSRRDFMRLAATAGGFMTAVASVGVLFRVERASNSQSAGSEFALPATQGFDEQAKEDPELLRLQRAVMQVSILGLKGQKTPLSSAILLDGDGRVVFPAVAAELPLVVTLRSERGEHDYFVRPLKNGTGQGFTLGEIVNQIGTLITPQELAKTYNRPISMANDEFLPQGAALIAVGFNGDGRLHAENLQIASDLPVKTQDGVTNPECQRLTSLSRSDGRIASLAGGLVAYNEKPAGMLSPNGDVIPASLIQAKYQAIKGQQYGNQPTVPAKKKEGASLAVPACR